MSDINDEQLPSIEDYSDNSNELPSVNDFLIEQELPSVSDFIEKKEEDIVEEIREEFVEDRNTSHDLNEVLHLINALRRDIPDIPEIKYYDEELGNLLEEVERVRNSIPEVKYYDEQIEKIENRLDLTDQNIDELPEVKYYEEDINFLQTRIDNIKKDISNLPEVKYYEEDIELLKTNIQEVLDSIPVFPKWVNEVNEVPDFSWIGKTFSVIDDDFIKVQDNLNSIQGRISREVNEITESIDVKAFESRVDIKGLTKNLEESKDKIYKELKEYSLRIWDHRNQFKDDDRKLKKQLLGEHNKLKQNLEKDLKELNDTNIESQNTITSALTEYFNEVKEDISNLPEVKYYDKDIQNLGEEVSQLDERIGSQGININELYKIVEELKKTQENLKESTLVSGPDPKLKQANDPLTPIDQEFDSLAKLAKSYKLFTSRVQTQLYTMGGGGAAFIKDLDDVTFDQETGGNKLLIYAGIQTGWIGISSNDLGGGAGVGGTWATDSVGIHTIKSVGIGTTADSSYQLLVKGDGHFTGNVSVAGTITYEDVKRVDSIGIVTARSGIRIGDGGTVGPSGSGIVTYFGDGSQLTGIIGGVGIQSGSTRIGIGFTDINFTGAGVSSIVGSGTTVTIDIPATTIRRQVETSSGITTDFAITNGYTVGFIDVYLNGVKQRSGTDFTASNGTTVTMVPHINDGDVLEFQVYENLTVASGGSSYSGTSGQLLQHDGSDYVGVSSVGIATFFNDHHQGYYRYSTNYYATGVANTVQTLPADEFVLIQPSIKTNKIDFMPKKMIDANSSDPWIGAGATIGTGQTEFSLAGLDDGSTVIVRIASQFNPDDDNTNLDFRLNFTTNPTTQGYGSTNFSITREQAIICNEGADQNYISEVLLNFYVGSSLSGMTTTTAGTFNLSARASNEGDFEMMALTVNMVA